MRLDQRAAAGKLVGGPFARKVTMSDFDPTKVTLAYVDGFNLYHLALRATQHRWIDPKILLENVLGQPGAIDLLKFYTANVSAKIDIEAPRKQQVYLSALETLNYVRIHKGSFQVHNKWRKIANYHDDTFKPTPVVVKVVNPEEKGSDVNLGVHLVRDAFTKQFEQAVVCTNDTDLCEPIRIVVQEIGLPVFLITPDNSAGRLGSTAAKLKTVVASPAHVFHMREQHMRTAALPSPIMRVGKPDLVMPPSWNGPATRS